MDAITKPRTETERLFADLGKPSLHALSYALRHPDTWPEGFYWNYDKCDHCAMGLAHVLWKDKIAEMTPPEAATSIVARAFAISYHKASYIFQGSFDWVPEKTKEVGFFRKRKIKIGEPDRARVTPEMVAEQIDKYLETVE